MPFVDMKAAVRSFFIALVLLASISFAPHANAAGLCSALYRESLPKSGFSFSSDRTVLTIKLEVDPASYFADSSLLTRARVHVPIFVFRIAHRLNRQLRPSRLVDFRDMLEVGFRYTYVLRNGNLSIGRIPKESKEVYSKHLVIADHQGVLMAGEMWIDASGRLNVSNASGSYKPPPERLHGMARYLIEQFQILNLGLYKVRADETIEPIEMRIYEDAQ